MKFRNRVGFIPPYFFCLQKLCWLRRHFFFGNNLIRFFLFSESSMMDRAVSSAYGADALGPRFPLSCVAAPGDMPISPNWCGSSSVRLQCPGQEAQGLVQSPVTEQAHSCSLLPHPHPGFKTSPGNKTSQSIRDFWIPTWVQGVTSKKQLFSLPKAEYRFSDRSVCPSVIPVRKIRWQCFN